MDTPSHCLYNFPSKMKHVSSIANISSSRNTCLSIPPMSSLSLKSSLQMMSVVSFNGMFVNNDVTSKEDMNRFESYSITSLANENESATVYSLVVTMLTVFYPTMRRSGLMNVLMTSNQSRIDAMWMTFSFYVVTVTTTKSLKST